MIAALGDFGFGSLGLTDADFLASNTIVQLGQAPKRIGILTTIDGVDFDDCWERHVSLPVSDLEIPFISAADLITNKEAAGRPQDLADAMAIREMLAD